MNDMVTTHGANEPQPPSPLSALEIMAYLDFASEQLIKRRDELIAALKASIKAYPEIRDDDVLATVAENMKMAAALKRLAETRRTEHKEPFFKGGQTVDKWFKRFGKPLVDAMTPTQALMDDYGARVLAERRRRAEEERRIAQAEADRQAEIAAEKLRANKPAGPALDRVIDAEDEAARATQVAQSRSADLTRVRGVYGATASVRETWAWRVTDAAKVPRGYLMIDPEAIKVAGKDRDATGRPTAIIPGIEWFAKQTMGVR